MPIRGYAKLGDHNYYCDVCGIKVKASQLIRRWDGALVDRRCWEPRNPQDYIVAKVRNRPAVPISPSIENKRTTVISKLSLPSNRSFCITDLNSVDHCFTCSPNTDRWVMDINYVNSGPSAPAVSGPPSPFELHGHPTWTWTSTDPNGSGNFRHKLDDTDLTVGATATTDLFYTPAVDLDDGTYTLYVQESNAQGIWSDSGSFVITIATVG